MGEYEVNKKLKFIFKTKKKSQVTLGLLRVFAHYSDLIWTSQ
jgi:hypothetical protein